MLIIIIYRHSTYRTVLCIWPLCFGPTHTTPFSRDTHSDSPSSRYRIPVRRHRLRCRRRRTLCPRNTHSAVAHPSCPRRTADRASTSPTDKGRSFQLQQNETHRRIYYMIILLHVSGLWRITSLILGTYI